MARHEPARIPQAGRHIRELRADVRRSIQERLVTAEAPGDERATAGAHPYQLERPRRRGNAGICPGLHARVQDISSAPSQRLERTAALFHDGGFHGGGSPHTLLSTSETTPESDVPNGPCWSGRRSGVRALLDYREKT